MDVYDTLGGVHADHRTALVYESIAKQSVSSNLHLSPVQHSSLKGLTRAIILIVLLMPVPPTQTTCA
jgi:hypothetical protein